MIELTLLAAGIFTNFLVEKPELRKYLKEKIKKLFSFGSLRSNKGNQDNIVVD
jgi:hypothetical protein